MNSKHARNETIIIMEFLKMYKALPCLWNTTDKMYTNKDARNKALGVLLKKWKESYPFATVQDVRKKIEHLRAAYRREKNKVKSSILAGDVNVYVPKLWYYEHMLFIEDPESAPTSNTALETLNDENIIEVYDNDVPSPQSQTSCSSKESTPRPSSSKRRKRTEHDLNKISARTDAMDERKQTRDASEAFGQYVAAELRNLPENTSIICKKIISDVIYQAAMGKLDASSQLVTDPIYSGITEEVDSKPEHPSY